MKISTSALYSTDNGAIYCGEHLGCTAKATGRDISGQRIVAIDPEYVRIAQDDYDYTPECESCGRKATFPKSQQEIATERMAQWSTTAIR